MTFFVCVGVMYVGEYDVCDVTLSVHSRQGKVKSLPDHGGNRTRDLWWESNPRPSSSVGRALD